MKKLIALIILSLLIINCSDINDELDKALLEKDKKELALKVDSYSVLTYKFIKKSRFFGYVNFYYLNTFTIPISYYS